MTNKISAEDIEILKKATKLNPIVKENWLKDLRSGEFKQGYLALHKCVNEYHSYCCLGVLASKHFQEIEYNRFDSIKYYTYGNSNEAMLSYLQQKQLNLDPGVVSILAYLNDNRVSFEVIANIIDAYL